MFTKYFIVLLRQVLLRKDFIIFSTYLHKIGMCNVRKIITHNYRYRHSLYDKLLSQILYLTQIELHCTFKLHNIVYYVNLSCNCCLIHVFLYYIITDLYTFLTQILTQTYQFFTMDNGQYFAERYKKFKCYDLCFTMRLWKILH